MGNAYLKSLRLSVRYPVIKLLQRDGRGNPRFIPHRPSGVSLTGQVLNQSDVSRTEPVDRTVAETQFNLSADGDDVLSPGTVVPIAEIPGRTGPERDPSGLSNLTKFRMGFQGQFLKM